MKNRFIIFTMLIITVFLLNGCSLFHVHSFDIMLANDDFLATEATCTEKATYYYSCSCGLHGEETFSFGETLPHSFDQIVIDGEYLASSATCSKQATYYYSCSCGACGTEVFSYGDLTPHNYQYKVINESYLATEATHLKPASYYYVCECGEHGSLTFEDGEEVSHSFALKVIIDAFLANEATCTHPSQYYYSCSCGECGTETFEYGEKLPHVFDKKVSSLEYQSTEASCTELSTFYYSCSCGECGTEVYSDGELEDHVYKYMVSDDSYLATAATCILPATYYYSCICGACSNSTFEYGNPLGHITNEGVTNINSIPSNYSDGSCNLVCPRCKENITHEYSKISFSDYVIVPYIEAFGNEYIDTGIVVNHNDSAILYLDFEFTEQLTNDWAGANGYLQFYYPMINDTNRHNISIEWNMKGDYFEYLYSDGVLNYTRNGTNTYYSNVTVGLFSCGDQNNSWWAKAFYCQKAKMYGGSITLNGNIVREFLPAINSKTGETGLLDIINNEFYVSENGYNFGLPEGYSSELRVAPTNKKDGIVSITYPNQQENLYIKVNRFDSSEFIVIPYIESAGFEYIDTGLIIDYYDSVEFKADYQFATEDYASWVGSNYLVELSYYYINHTNRFNLTIDYNLDGNRTKYIYDNGELVFSRDHSSRNLTNEKFGIFRLGVSGNDWYSSDYQIQRARIYSASIRINGVLVGYYIPVFNVKTGENGLYDAVKGRFLTNEGDTGNFKMPEGYTEEISTLPTNETSGIRSIYIPGYDKPFEYTIPKIDINEYEIITCIESSGTNYIDTGLHMNFTDSAIIDYDYQLLRTETRWSGTNYFLQYSSSYVNHMNRFNLYETYNIDGDLTTRAYEGDVLVKEISWGYVNRNNNKIGIFWLGDQSDTWWGNVGQKARFYGGSITINGKIEGYYIPVKNVSTGKLGLYDVIKGVFLGCAIENNDLLTPHTYTYKCVETSTSWKVTYACDFCSLTRTSTVKKSTSPIDNTKYQVVPFIENEIGAYIETGVELSYDNGFKVQALYTPTSITDTTARGCLLSNFQRLENNIFIEAYNNNMRFYADLAKVNMSRSGLKINMVNNYSLSYYDGLFTANLNNSISTFSADLSGTINGKLSMFSDLPDGKLSSKYTVPLRVYSMKIYDGTDLIRDFVPVYNIELQEYGLLDVVNDKYYGNCGTGKFTCDYKSSSIDDFTTIDKIVFNGETTLHLTEKYNNKFIIDGKAFDGKEIYPLYDGFYYFGSGTNYSYSKLFELYGVKSEMNGKIVHNYIPVRRNSDNVEGLYDTVSKWFYPIVNKYDDSITDYFFEDSSVYNPDMSLLAIKAQTEHNGFERLYTSYDYQVLTKYDEDSTSSYDGTHKVPYLLIKKDYIYNDEIYHLYMLIISGTTGESEWTSNFTIGNNKSGFHSGFESGADFVLEGISEYISDDMEHNKILISGHSRGSAVSSIVAAKLMEDGSKFKQDNMFVYTFACPNYSCRNVHYSNIFQLCSQGDMVSFIPIESWGFTKEGVVIYFDNDDATLELLDQRIREYEEADGLVSNGYTGQRENIKEQVELLGKFISSKTIRDNRNSSLLTRLFYAYNDGEELSVSDMVLLLSQLKFNGSIQEMYEVARFFIDNQQKNTPSHRQETYYCWTLIYNESLQ